MVLAKVESTSERLSGFGPSRVTARDAHSGQVAALAQDVLDFADALGIDRFGLVGQDWGSRAAQSVAVLAPHRITRLIALATGYGPAPDDPELRLRQAQVFWYQWWFHTEMGRLALEQDRAKVCAYLRRVWSPKWQFSPDEFAAIVPSLGNEQFVETVIHYYRHRRNAAPGNQRYEQHENKLRGTPPIPVPTVFVCGTADACNLPESSRGNEKLFPAGLERIELPGVGHFVQRERPGRGCGLRALAPRITNWAARRVAEGQKPRTSYAEQTRNNPVGRVHDQHCSTREKGWEFVFWIEISH
jgi:pimeloyl-ACP methyl ester carboxylesterase